MMLNPNHIPMKPTHLPFLAIATALTFAACDSKQEQQREKALENAADRIEDKADATKKAAEQKADAIEEQKKADAKAADKTADAVRKEGKQAADAEKKQADAIREQK
jgi:flagellar biosynthesis component FlhA